MPWNIHHLVLPYLGYYSVDCLSLALACNESKQYIQDLYEGVICRPRAEDWIAWLSYCGRRDLIPYYAEYPFSFGWMFQHACRGKQIHLVNWILKQKELYELTCFFSELLYCGLRSECKEIMLILCQQLPWSQIHKNEMALLWQSVESYPFARSWLDHIYKKYKSFSTQKQFVTHYQSWGPSFSY